jgi:hypothetical protein
MRAVVSFKNEKKKNSKTCKSLYIRYRTKRELNAFIKRAAKAGMIVKIFRYTAY